MDSPWPWHKKCSRLIFLIFCRLPADRWLKKETEAMNTGHILDAKDILGAEAP